jgi:hypothetical protein
MGEKMMILKRIRLIKRGDSELSIDEEFEV